MGGLEFALGDVALDVDLDLARADLVGVELCVGLDHLELVTGSNSKAPVPSSSKL